jgi:hypothetical protein
VNSCRECFARVCSGLAILVSLLHALGAKPAESAELPVAEILDRVSVPAADRNGNEISELSGLAWDADEQLLYGVSDSGFIVHFRIAIAGNKISKIAPILVAPIEEYEGLLSWSLSNAEAVLARNSTNGKKSDTELVVALEDGPVIARFTPGGQFIAEIKLPAPLAKRSAYISNNKRLESVSETPGHVMITAPEAPLVGEPEDVHTIYAENGATWSFKAVQPFRSSIKDIERLPDGRLLILERTRDDASKANQAHLRLLDTASCTTGTLCDVIDVVPSDANAMAMDFEGLTRIAPDLYLLVTDEKASELGGGQLLLLRLRE